MRVLSGACWAWKYCQIFSKIDWQSLEKINIRLYKYWWYSHRQQKHEVVVIYLVCRLDMAQGYLDGVPNETRIHSWRFTSLAC